MTIHARTSIVATLLAIALMSGCAATPSTEEEHAAHHPEAANTAGAAVGNTAPAAMAAMQAEMGANMKKMQEQMAALHKTTDPKEHARLLDEHMQTMKAMMQGMQKGSGGMMMGEGGMPIQGKEAGSGMGMMPMMQMMMEQMMQHQKAMEGAPK